MPGMPDKYWQMEEMKNMPKEASSLTCIETAKKTIKLESYPTTQDICKEVAYPPLAKYSSKKETIHTSHYKAQE